MQPNPDLANAPWEVTAYLLGLVCLVGIVILFVTSVFSCKDGEEDYLRSLQYMQLIVCIVGLFSFGAALFGTIEAWKELLLLTYSAAAAIALYFLFRRMESGKTRSIVLPASAYVAFFVVPMIMNYFIESFINVIAGNIILGLFVAATYGTFRGIRSLTIDMRERKQQFLAFYQGLIQEANNMLLSDPYLTRKEISDRYVTYSKIKLDKVYENLEAAGYKITDSNEQGQLLIPIPVQ